MKIKMMKVSVKNQIVRLCSSQKIACISLTTLLFTSCVSYKSVSQTELSSKQLKISPPLKRGDVIGIIMKSGEKIEKLKVKEIDSLKVSGVQLVETTVQWIHVNKTIQLADIIEIKKRHFSAAKTVGAILAGGSIPLLVVALNSHPLGVGFAWGQP